jgi:surfactin synthase thioesterase subunit
MKFVFSVLRKYKEHRRQAMLCDSPVYAFFGTHDHYRRSGIVSVRTWKKHFGETFSMYEGTHFMEEGYVRTMLVDKILEVLDINR